MSLRRIYRSSVIYGKANKRTYSVFILLVDGLLSKIMHLRQSARAIVSRDVGA